MKAIQVFYEGRVQGVGFRYSVRQIAKGFNVTGWVRNLADGRVEMQASGESQEVDAFLEGIRQSDLSSLIRKESATALTTPPDTHAVDRYLKLAEAFGAPLREGLRFPIPTGDQLPRFDAFPGFVVLHPFARGHNKSIGANVILEFCRALAPARVVVVGKSKRKFSTPENCVDLTNQTSLLQLIWLLRAAAFVISVDSGPMHVAAAVTTNLVSIHTRTDPRRVGPYNEAATIWKNGKLIRVADLESGTDLRKRGRKFVPDDVGPVADLALRALAKQPLI